MDRSSEIEERKGGMKGKQCKKINFILEETRKYFKSHNKILEQQKILIDLLEIRRW